MKRPKFLTSEFWKDRGFIIKAVTVICFLYFAYYQIVNRSPPDESLLSFFFFLIAFILGFMRNEISILKTQSIAKISDEKRLLIKKKEYLDKILDTLKLEVDNDLKTLLENGDIEEANDEIEEKINALNTLVETVNGNSNKALRGTDISSVSEFYESTNIRIRSEITRIENNSTVNLAVGIVFSFISIAPLVWGIYLTDIHPKELIELLPRVGVSVLIQAFAFFFFNQYRKQQDEIKYWNNEKTNLDLKIFALSIAIDDYKVGTPEFMQDMISSLLNGDKSILSTDTKEQKSNVSPKSDVIKEGSSLIDDVLKKTKEAGDLATKYLKSS